MVCIHHGNCSLKTIGVILGSFLWQLLPAQKKLDLGNLNAFEKPGGNWHIAGDVKVNLDSNNSIAFYDGTGILLNQPGKNAHEDLFSNFQHGDIDLELDYLMAKGSNSGIYLQSRYEVQLLDSWTVLNPRSGDNGGIYERWDDTKPDGQKGYQGHAPRQNASLAPGLWQHLKISFQAPRFKDGFKVENAKMLSVELNGVLIHENVELSGVTRGAIDTMEVATAPLRLQGDHGPVAFRNIVINNFNKKKPSVSGINYSIFKGKFEKEPDYRIIKALSQRTTQKITLNIAGLPENEFLVRYTGILHIDEPGEYIFGLNTAGGTGLLKINKATVISSNDKFDKGTANLQSGDFPIELIYSKYVDWAKPKLVLSVKGPGIREFLVSEDNNFSVERVVDPILVSASEKNILRSFMDLPGSIRVTHGVSVGSGEKIHYTYDMNHGMIVQVWRGNFLDATPMWHERGDGSSKPAGTVKYLGTPFLFIEKLNDQNTRWSSDTTGTGFKAKGYVLDEKDRPVFKYLIYGTTVSDTIRVIENRQGIYRNINIENGAENMFARLAEGERIEMLSDGFFIIDDKSYYLKINTNGGEQPLIREQNGRKELIIPVKTKLSYTIFF